MSKVHTGGIMNYKIKLPFKTPTINHLYGRSFKHNRPYMKPEAKKLREEIKEIIVNQAFPLFSGGENRFKVTVAIHENWYTKKNTVKRKDVANREKFLIDSVFEALGIEDKFIFDHRMIKIQDIEKEFAEITIEVLNGTIGCS